MTSKRTMRNNLNHGCRFPYWNSLKSCWINIIILQYFNNNHALQIQENNTSQDKSDMLNRPIEVLRQSCLYCLYTIVTFRKQRSAKNVTELVINHWFCLLYFLYMRVLVVFYNVYNMTCTFYNPPLCVCNETSTAQYDAHILQYALVGCRTTFTDVLRCPNIMYTFYNLSLLVVKRHLLMYLVLLNSTQ